jgi:membrane protein YdbS with pleckstrin-like domain
MVRVEERVSATDSAVAKVKRGAQSWAYIYLALGFVLAIEATVIPMITSLTFPLNVVAFVSLGAATFYAFLFNGWFQNTVIRFRNWYEEKQR